MHYCHEQRFLRSVSLTRAFFTIPPEEDRFAYIQSFLYAGLGTRITCHLSTQDVIVSMSSNTFRTGDPDVGE